MAFRHLRAEQLVEEMGCSSERKLLAHILIMRMKPRSVGSYLFETTTPPFPNTTDLIKCYQTLNAPIYSSYECHFQV